MVVQNREGIVWKITFIVVLVLGPNTFELRSNTDPTIVVTGEATKYTLVDDGIRRQPFLALSQISKPR
jgi:hypothetical protein